MDGPRKSKQFWAIDDFWNICFVLGFECDPPDGNWWVPELGYSLSEKHHLFSDKEAATACAIKKLESNIGDLQVALRRLKPTEE